MHWRPTCTALGRWCCALSQDVRLPLRSFRKAPARTPLPFPPITFCCPTFLHACRPTHLRTCLPELLCYCSPMHAVQQSRSVLLLA